MLAAMPAGDRLCHGDFHPGNIMVLKQGEMIIDWIDAAIGNPLADIARTTVIFLGAIAAHQIKQPFMKFILHLFHDLYIHNYFSIRPGGENQYRQWLPIVAAARLSENIPELEKWLISQTGKA